MQKTRRIPLRAHAVFLYALISAGLALVCLLASGQPQPAAAADSAAATASSPASATAASAPAFLPLSFEALESFGSDSRSILSLQQDRQGFIWIGTIEGGLFRYDGRGVVKYANDPANPASLPAGRVSALYCDAQGRMWAGTDDGLARFDPVSNGFIRYLPDSKQSNTRIVRRIMADGAQGMWLATWGGLQHFDPASGRFQLFQADDQQPGALAHNDVNAIAMDRQGGVWASTWPAGIDYLAPGRSTFQHLRLDTPEQPDPKLNDVRALRYDPSGTLWIGTDAGVVLWQSGTPWTERRRVSGPLGRINSIDADSSGGIWVSTRTEGLLRWDQSRQRFQSYGHRAEDPHSLPTNAINAVIEDRSGTLWVATFTNGVSRANMGNYGLERIVPRDVAPDSFPSSNFVRSLGAAPDGLLWLGGDDGLALYDPAARQLLKKYTAQPGQPGSLSHNSVYSLYQQPGGPLWVGTSKGLHRLDAQDGRFATIRFENSADNFINVIAPGSGGVLWLGTAASLIRYHPDSGEREFFRHDDSRSDSRSVNDTTTVLEDRQGRIWVGDSLRGGGLDLMTPNSGGFQHFIHDPARPNSLSSDKVTSLHEDKNGVIWVGTARGLNRVMQGAGGKLELRSYLGPTDPGAILIEAIQSDAAGILWISSINGLSRLDPERGAFTHYSVDDGVTEGMYQGVSAAGTDGRLYFGSTTGVTAVAPALPLRAPTPPQIAITDIRIFDKSLSHGPRRAKVVLDGAVTDPKALTLPWNASVLAIEFAALHYAASKRNGYEYWLEGFDQDWVRADASHPVATYTNLYPGSYRFHLRAISNKGLPSADIVLPITVTPPFWQTWWFRIGVLMLTLLCVMLAYRMRVRSLTRHARRLETLVDKRTHELQLSNQKLQALSATDGLTGLANRRCFDEALAREWSRAKRSGEPLALAMLDVDCFKLYNDHYGHQAGDACLREVARALTLGVQRATDLAARYGGEEFVFLAPATGSADAADIAEKIRAALEQLQLPHERAPRGCVTISIGVAAIIPSEHQDAEQLVRAADQALYGAKAHGRNCVMQAKLAQAANSTDSQTGVPA